MLDEGISYSFMFLLLQCKLLLFFHFVCLCEYTCMCSYCIHVCMCGSGCGNQKITSVPFLRYHPPFYETRFSLAQSPLTRLH